VSPAWIDHQAVTCVNPATVRPYERQRHQGRIAYILCYVACDDNQIFLRDLMR
jgi:hypothetical protein